MGEYTYKTGAANVKCNHWRRLRALPIFPLEIACRPSQFFSTSRQTQEENIGTARSLALSSMRARSYQWQTRVFLLLGSSKSNEQLKNEHSSTAKICARAQFCEHLINFGGPFASPIRTEVNHCLGWSSDTEPS